MINKNFRLRHLLYGLIPVVCWSVSPLLIRYVKDDFSVSFQNFYRFSAAIIMLWAFTFSTVSRAELKAVFVKLSGIKLKLVITAFFTFLHQAFLVAAVYEMQPGLATLLEESVIIFSVAFAFVLFPDERRMIARPAFLLSFTVALAGFLVAVVNPAEFSTFKPGPGLWYILGSSFTWAVFSVLVKLWLKDLPSSVGTPVIFTLITPFFLAAYFFGSGGAAWPEADLSVWIILTVSGLIGLGGGYGFYYKALPLLGVTLSSMLGLLIPVFTVIMSFAFFGEVLKVNEVLGGLMLLAGCFLIIRNS